MTPRAIRYKQPDGRRKTPSFEELIRRRRLARAKRPTKQHAHEWIQKLYKQSKRNAKVRGIKWELTPVDMGTLVEMAGGKCAVTGVELNLERLEGARRRPFAPSLDRIVSSEGYTLKNCRIVCAAANLAMNEWGIEILRQMAHSMVEKERA